MQRKNIENPYMRKKYVMNFKWHTIKYICIKKNNKLPHQINRLHLNKIKLRQKILSKFHHAYFYSFELYY